MPYISQINLTSLQYQAAQANKLQARVKELDQRMEGSEASRLWDAVCRVYSNPEAFVDHMEAEAAAVEQPIKE